MSGDVIAFPPAGARARLTILLPTPGQPDAYAVVVALPPLEPDPANLLRPGEMAALVTHDRGLVWPDAAGEAVAAETLARGGVVALVFACFVDTSACRSWIGCGGAA